MGKIPQLKLIRSVLYLCAVLIQGKGQQPVLNVIVHQSLRTADTGDMSAIKQISP